MTTAYPERFESFIIVITRTGTNLWVVGNLVFLPGRMYTSLDKLMFHMLVIDPYIIRKSKKNYENADNSLIDSENNTVVNDESLLIKYPPPPKPTNTRQTYDSYVSNERG
jgi:hypothetical protein